MRRLPLRPAPAAGWGHCQTATALRAWSTPLPWTSNTPVHERILMTQSTVAIDGTQQHTLRMLSPNFMSQLTTMPLPARLTTISQVNGPYPSVNAHHLPRLAAPHSPGDTQHVHWLCVLLVYVHRCRTAVDQQPCSVDQHAKPIQLHVLPLQCIGVAFEHPLCIYSTQARKQCTQEGECVASGGGGEQLWWLPSPTCQV